MHPFGMIARVERICTPKSVVRSPVCAAIALLGALPSLALGNVPTAAASPSGAPSSLRDQANRLGVKSCSAAFETLGNALTLGSTFALTSRAAPRQPDAHAVQGLAGLNYNTPDKKGAAAGVFFAAPLAGGCEGNFVRIAPVDRSCADAVGLLPKGSVKAQDLEGTPLYNLPERGGQVMLLPSGASCVVVSVAQLAPAG